MLLYTEEKMSKKVMRKMHFEQTSCINQIGVGVFIPPKLKYTQKVEELRDVKKDDFICFSVLQ